MSPSLYADSLENHIFIGKGRNDALGYLAIQDLPLNHLYGVIDIYTLHCKAHVQGPIDQQDHRFILTMEIPDFKSTTSSKYCQIFFKKTGNSISIVKESHCEMWHGITCSFVPMQLQQVIKPSTPKNDASIRKEPVHQTNLPN